METYFYLENKIGKNRSFSPVFSTEQKHGSASLITQNTSAKADSVSISLLDISVSELQWYRSQILSADTDTSDKTDEAKKLAMALKIAQRILNGDHVPPQDEQFLMEYSMELYSRVKLMAVPKDEPEECDSVVDEESQSADSSGSGEETAAESTAGEAVSETPMANE